MLLSPSNPKKGLVFCRFSPQGGFITPLVIFLVVIGSIGAFGFYSFFQSTQVPPIVPPSVITSETDTNPTLEELLSDENPGRGGENASSTPSPVIEKIIEKQEKITTIVEKQSSNLPDSQEHALLVGNGSGGWSSTEGLRFTGKSLSFFTDSPTAALQFTLQDPKVLGMIIRAHKDQTANLAEWQNSDGNPVVSFDSNGGATFNSQGKNTDFRVKALGQSSALFVEGNGGNIGIGTDSPSSALEIVGNQEINGVLTLRNTANDQHLIELYPTGSTGHLNASGGAFYIDNTNNIGAGYLVYSNAGAEAEGNLLNVKVDNAAFAQAGFYISYDGSSNGVEIVSNANDTSSNALAVTGHNTQDSTVGIIGYETGRGTVKISHNGTGNDANASAISIDLKGTGTAAQGIYVDSTATSGTTGNLLRLRNQGIDRFVVSSTGSLSMGQNGTNTSITKEGNTAGDEFFVGTTGAFRVQRSSAGSEAFRVQVNGDTQGRWLGTSDGQLKWGSGTATQDVVLRRNGAGVLMLDGARFESKSAGLATDVMVWTASDGSRLGRVNETSSGHGWFEIADNGAIAKFLVRADGGDSYFNSGEFGIGTITPGYKLDVQGNAAASYVGSFTNAGNDAARYGLQVQAGANDGSGTTYYMTALDGDGTVVGYLQNSSGTFSVNDPSDVRTKTNIMNTTIDGLSVIEGLRVVDFDRISQPGGKRHHGFIAQEVQSVFPYMVSESPDGLLTISKEALVPVLVKAVQEQQLQIESLGALAQTSAETSQLAILQASVDALERRSEASLLRSELSPLARWSTDTWSWISQVIFEQPATFLSDVELKGTTKLQGKVLNEQRDLAGVTFIAAGAQQVTVTFSQPLLATPVVQVTPEGSFAELSISNVDHSGFVIHRKDVSDQALKIHWLALPSLSANDSTSPEFSAGVPSPTPAVQPDFVASGSASPQP